MLDYLMPVKVGLHLITLQSSEFLNKMTFGHNYEATWFHALSVHYQCTISISGLFLWWMANNNLILMMVIKWSATDVQRQRITTNSSTHLRVHHGKPDIMANSMLPISPILHSLHWQSVWWWLTNFEQWVRVKHGDD